MVSSQLSLLREFKEKEVNMSKIRQERHFCFYSINCHFPFQDFTKIHNRKESLEIGYWKLSSALYWSSEIEQNT
jgi:hypothetical protein